jgi:hypothetical protein
MVFLSSGDCQNRTGDLEIDHDWITLRTSEYDSTFRITGFVDFAHQPEFYVNIYQFYERRSTAFT